MPRLTARVTICAVCICVHQASGLAAEPPMELSVAAPPAAGSQPTSRPTVSRPKKVQQRPTASPQISDGHLMLIRSTLLALDHANSSGDYSIIHKLGTAAFQAEGTVEKLALSFAAFRDQKIDVSPIAVITPQLLQPPLIDQNGNLRLIGVFPTQPLRLQFDLAYQQLDGRWRQSGISVSAQPAQGRELRLSNGSERSAPARQTAPLLATRRQAIAVSN
jgi:hypothetical protein